MTDKGAQMKWVFPSVRAGEYKGLNEAGIQIFRDDVVSGLAREICQNSLDAKDRSIDESIPVRVEFKQFKITKSEFPGLEAFREELIACKTTAQEAGDKHVENWATSRMKIVDADTIDVLRISDFNTTGLLGSKTFSHTQPWGSLVNARESSVKSNTAGGSFGIGKFATFACSEIRTVFFSTYSNDREEAFQGVSRLVSSRKIVDGIPETTTGFGFYGEPTGLPGSFQSKLDKDFYRGEGEYGTDIYILGFSTYYDDPELWKDSVIISALNGFLLAVYEGKLEIKVDDTIISASNLGEIIKNYENEKKCIATEYYDVLTSNDTEWKTDENFLSSYGEIRLGILINEDYQRKIAGVRSTGMLVQEFKKGTYFVDYAGVLLLKGAGINEILRKMENPQHNKWSAEFLNENKQLGKNVLKGINLFIEKCLSEIISGKDVDEFDADVGAFLPDEEINDSNDKGETEAIGDKIEEITPSRKIIEVPRRSEITDSLNNIPSEISTENDGTDEIYGGSGHGDGKSSSNGDGFGADVGSGQGGVQEGLLNSFGPIQLKQLRLLSVDRKTNTYLLFLTPSISSESATIQIYIASENRTGDNPVKLKDCIITGQTVSFSGNSIKNINLRKDTPLKITFSITFNDLCSMEFKVNGYR